MGKPFDVSKFRKGITKSIDGISVGFHDPKYWISTGNYTLNYIMSKRFDVGVPLGKVTVFAGPSGSGKSYIVSGTIIREAQAQDIFVILVDTENALDEVWLNAPGVDTSEDKLLKLNMSMVNDVGKMLSDFIKSYRESPSEDRPKVLIVVDSLGMLLTPTAVAQFEGGDMKGDMGIKAKQLKALVTNCVNSIADLDIGLLCTNHTYESQDPYNPDGIVSGGSGFVFASSMLVVMKQLKLKEDAEGNKVSDVLGIRAGCKIMKTRYNKPFETIEVKIPYSTGIDPYSGLFEMFEKHGMYVKDGNRYVYTDLSGVEHKYFRKQYLVNTDGILDKIMAEFHDKIASQPTTIMEEPEEIPMEEAN